MKRQCRICGRLLDVNELNFYRKSKGAHGFRSECKKCNHVKPKFKMDPDNPFLILHEWLECAFGIGRGNVEGQLAIIMAIGNVLGRGFA